MAFFRCPSEDSLASESGIQRCPFLRNINAPTNFSFSSAVTVGAPAHGAKGPIFEDGPNFDSAFRLFHGRDGVVPLSGRSYVPSEIVGHQARPHQFNPLAAKAATISLSGFGGPFSFDAFSEMFKNQNKKPNPAKKKQSSQGGHSKHVALSNEWLETGNCPIAKSYQAVSKVLPLVAKALQPPAGMKLRCPPAIVAGRAALARTALVKTIRPQTLPTKVLMIGALGMAANVPLGIWREHTEKFSPSWFAAVHAAVPFIAMLRKSVLMPKTAMAFTIAASILGQVIGSRAERYRLKAAATKNLSLSAAPVSNMNSAASSVCSMGTVQVATVKSSNSSGHCGDSMDWDSGMLKIAGSSTPTDVFC
uniref:Uncharacterized protein n=1 Tax=Kalanchoe fedtschenkoi TaxID=63787 RepID=A0A7N0V7X4_KALFE